MSTNPLLVFPLREEDIKILHSKGTLKSTLKQLYHDIIFLYHPDNNKMDLEQRYGNTGIKIEAFSVALNAARDTIQSNNDNQLYQILQEDKELLKAVRERLEIRSFADLEKYYSEIVELCQEVESTKKKLEDTEEHNHRLQESLNDLLGGGMGRAATANVAQYEQRIRVLEDLRSKDQAESKKQKKTLEENLRDEQRRHSEVKRQCESAQRENSSLQWENSTLQFHNRNLEKEKTDLEKKVVDFHAKVVGSHARFRTGSIMVAVGLLALGGGSWYAVSTKYILEQSIAELSGTLLTAENDKKILTDNLQQRTKERDEQRVLYDNMKLKYDTDMKEGDVEHLINSGIAEYQFNNDKGAIDKYKEAIKVDPSNAKAYSLMAKAQERSKNFRDALKSLRTAAQLQPNSQTLHAVASYLVETAVFPPREKRLDEAMTHVTTAIEQAPQESRLFALKGDIHAAREEWFDVVSAFEKAIELDAKWEIKDWEFFDKLGDAHMTLNQLEGAVGAYTEAYALAHINDQTFTPDTLSIRKKRGEAHRLLESYDLAIEDFTYYIDQYNFEPKETIYFEAYVLRAQAFFEKKEYKRAEIDCTLVINQLRPHNAAAKGLLEDAIRVMRVTKAYLPGMSIEPFKDYSRADELRQQEGPKQIVHALTREDTIQPSDFMFKQMEESH